MHDITLITGNAGKVAELSRLLAIDLRNQKLHLPEVQAIDVREVAKAKAEAAYAQLQRPVVVDDSGLFITAWGGLPGALIAWFMDTVGCDGILKMMAGWDDRSARVVTALGYCDERGVRVFDGELEGRIADEARGKHGFGYDPLFIPAGYDMTFAELGSATKDTISMRAIAARKLASYLEASA